MPFDGPFDFPPQQDEWRGPLEWTGATPAVRIVCAKLWRGVVNKGSRAFGWMLGLNLEVFDDDGDHTPMYWKIFRYGNASIWPWCSEIRDYGGGSGNLAAEILVLTHGPSPLPATRPRWLLRLFGGTIEGADQAEMDGAIYVGPVANRTPPKFKNGLVLDIDVENAVAIPAGSYVTIDRDRNIGLTFAEQQGMAQLRLKNATPAFQVQMSLGRLHLDGPDAGLTINGRRVKLEFEPEKEE